MRDILKLAARVCASLAVSPVLISFALRSPLLGRDRALEGSSQLLGLIPGVLGQYMRRAFLARALADCHHTATIGFGVLFSHTGASIAEGVYIGPNSTLGLARIDHHTLLGSGVHVTSGRHTHDDVSSGDGIDASSLHRTPVSIGARTWIGSAAIVMADVGSNVIVGAGAVVTKPVPDSVVVGGVPARVIRSRVAAPAEDAQQP